MSVKNRQSFKSLIFLVLAFQLFVIKGSFAQYPDRTITIINSNNPGGVIDLMSRKLAVIAKKYENVTIIVDNIPGGSGTAAMNYVLNQPADGYTLLATLKSFISTGLLSEAGVSLNDFHLVACMVYDWEAIITNRNSEVSSFDDILIDAERKNGRQRWLGPNTGGMDHLMALETWEKCGIQARWIPFEGSSVSIAALLGGNGTVYVGNPSDIVGRPNLNIAAIASPNRLPDFPNVPTLKEKGYDLNKQMWRGFSVKLGTPKSELEFLESLFYKIGQDPEWEAYIKSGFAEPVFLNHSEMAEQLKDDESSARRLLTKAGVINEEIGRSNTYSGLNLLMFLIMSTALTFIVYIYKKRTVDKEFVIHVLLIGLPIFFIYQSSSFPGAQEFTENSPALIPRFWSFGLLAFSLTSLISNSGRPTLKEMFLRPKSLPIYAILLLLIYLGGIFLFGFYLSSILFMIAILWLLNYKRPIQILCIVFGFLILIYFLFEKALNINLPNGIWL